MASTCVHVGNIRYLSVALIEEWEGEQLVGVGLVF